MSGLKLQVSMPVLWLLGPASAQIIFNACMRAYNASSIGSGCDSGRVGRGLEGKANCMPAFSDVPGPARGSEFWCSGAQCGGGSLRQEQAELGVVLARHALEPLQGALTYYAPEW